ncbi:hypothetical protein WA026_012303 [Henosepilachna vigintioctopunctata]|uniref:Uncharacterized protein n=1 Tax=Henosepilachna vigintioctopunctata TaxID=420089 RepID=A0AAW1UWS7_9CUCU
MIDTGSKKSQCNIFHASKMIPYCPVPESNTHPLGGEGGIKCEETDSERSSDEEILGDEALKTLHKRMGKNRKKSKAFNEVAMSTEEMFKKIINKITDLEQAISFNGDTLDELKKNFEDLRKENKCIRKENEKLKLDVQELKIEVSSLKHKAESAAFTADSKSREKNVIIMGRQSKEEIVKVLKTLNSGLNEEDIKVRSIPSKSDMKSFIVTFNNKDTRDKVLLKRKDRGNLNSKNMHLEGVERNIYINEDLPIEVQKLLRKWVKNGLVFCRAGESSKSVMLKNMEHVDQLKQEKTE